jgi:hypothetical protein
VIKAIASLPDGRKLLVVGLSFVNLDKFRAEPLDSFIRIDGKEIGLGLDVMIFSGKTEAELGHALSGLIGPETKVHIDPKLKS